MQSCIRTSCLLLSTTGCLRAVSSSLPAHWDKASRSSHHDFFVQRDWSSVETFWRHAVTSGALPPALNMNPDYAQSDCGLRQIQEIGMLGEFKSRDSRYLSRRTYALRIGYLGTAFHVLPATFSTHLIRRLQSTQGYQRQRDRDGSSVRTVEGEVRRVLDRAVVCAGRTDGDVSALSQVEAMGLFSDRCDHLSSSRF